MFEDMAIFTIWVIQNMLIAMLAILMWYISKWSRDENRHEIEVCKNEVDRKSLGGEGT